MRLKGVFAGDATVLAVLRLRLLGNSSVDASSQPAEREEEEEAEDEEEETEEEEEAALLTLGTFCFVCTLETRDFLLPSTGALQFLFLCSPSSIHGLSWPLQGS